MSSLRWLNPFRRSSKSRKADRLVRKARAKKHINFEPLESRMLLSGGQTLYVAGRCGQQRQVRLEQFSQLVHQPRRRHRIAFPGSDGSGDTLIFDAQNYDFSMNGYNDLTNLNTAGNVLTSIQIVGSSNNSTDSCTLTGNAVTLNGPTGLQLTNYQPTTSGSNAYTATVSLAGINLGANQTWSNAQGILNVTSPISANDNALVVNATVTGTATNSTTLSGGISLLSNSGSAYALTVIGPGRAVTVDNALSLGGASTLYANTGSTLNLTSTNSGAIANNGDLLTLGGPGTIAVSAGISGGGGLGIGASGLNSAGTYTLSGSNTYNGATTLTSGVLRITSSGGLNSSSPVTVASGAALDLSGGITVAATAGITISGTGIGATGAIYDTSSSGTDTLNGTVTLSGAADIGASAGGTLAIGASVVNSSSNPLTLVGAGTINFTGAVNINSNALATSWASGGSGSVAGSQTLSGPTSLPAGLTFSGGSINLNGYTLTLSGSGASTISDNITGTNSSSELLMSGTGTLLLTGTNSYSGSTVISSGTLEVNTATGLSPNAAVTVDSGAALALSGGVTVTATAGITISGTGVASNGAIENLSGTNTLNGTITLAGGTTNHSDIGAATGTTLNIGASISNSDGNPLTLVGAGTVNITSTLSAIDSVALNTQWATGGSGSVAGSYTLGGTTFLAGGVSFTGGSINLNGHAMMVQGGGTIGDNLSGTGAGSVLIVDTGGSTLTLSGTNTYAGDTYIEAGMMEVTSAAALSSSTTIYATSLGSLGLSSTGAGFTVSANIYIQNTGPASNGAIENVAGTNTFNGNISLLGNATIGCDAGTLTLGGSISTNGYTLTVAAAAPPTSTAW